MRPLKKLDHRGKVLNPPQRCVRMCRAILLEILQKKIRQRWRNI
jgi:hypothetical protein